MRAGAERLLSFGSVNFGKSNLDRFLIDQHRQGVTITNADDLAAQNLCAGSNRGKTAGGYDKQARCHSSSEYRPSYRASISAAVNPAISPLNNHASASRNVPCLVARTCKSLRRALHSAVSGACSIRSTTSANGSANAAFCDARHLIEARNAAASMRFNLGK